MWVVDIRFWAEYRGADRLERLKLHAAAVDEWYERLGDRPGFDPFSEEGAFEIEAAEAAIRRGERW
jgi:predicted outer membrane protein